MPQQDLLLGNVTAMEPDPSWLDKVRTAGCHDVHGSTCICYLHPNPAQYAQTPALRDLKFFQIPTDFHRTFVCATYDVQLWLAAFKKVSTGTVRWRLHVREQQEHSLTPPCASSPMYDASPSASKGYGHHPITAIILSRPASRLRRFVVCKSYVVWVWSR